MGLGDLGRLFQYGRICLAVSHPQIISNSTTKENRLLGHITDGFPELMLSHLTDIGPLQGDHPAGHVIKAQHQTGNGTLARPGAPDNSRRLTLHTGKTDTLQNRFLRAPIGETDLIKDDFCRIIRFLQGRLLGFIRNFRDRIQYLLGSIQTSLHLRQHYHHHR